MNRTELYRLALERWGVQAQVGMAVEECAEFVVAVMKQGRNVNGATTEDLCGEIADVEIMMEQMHVIFNHDTIEKLKKQKLERLAGLLEVDLDCLDSEAERG
ncbi:MAG: hypothetical protein PHZ19_09935 [Candidatus Thermoplasmatota archaeon]|nr:hypothetical protein [Candidatus Thermoplasmatota archaeon]